MVKIGGRHRLMVMAADINSVDLHRLTFLEAYGGGIRIQGRMDKLFSVFFRRENAVGVLTYPVQESGVLEIRLAGDEFSDGLFLQNKRPRDFFLQLRAQVSSSAKAAPAIMKSSLRVWSTACSVPFSPTTITPTRS